MAMVSSHIDGAGRRHHIGFLNIRLPHGNAQPRFGQAAPSRVPAPTETLQRDLFAPFPKTDRMNRFLVIGDAGYGSAEQRAVAEQMRALYDRQSFGSVLVLGDNIYNHGEPKRFKELIYEPYKALFDLGIKFFPVLGNHDVNRGHGDRQLAYWGAPPFYNFRLGPPGNQVEFFAVDTTVMLPGDSECYTHSPTLAQKSMISRNAG
ncbi:MAG TPA: metallophosphoesterase [Coleofasciculaceae cyanobacterium]|jgi:hypothetical protein